MPSNVLTTPSKDQKLIKLESLRFSIDGYFASEHDVVRENPDLWLDLFMMINLADERLRKRM